MKIRWSSLFHGPFALHFQIKLSTHGSNLNSTFVIMSELVLKHQGLGLGQHQEVQS